MLNELLTGARYPTQSDGPLGGLQIGNAVQDLADKTLPRFATSGARDAAYQAWVAAGHGMVAGLHCVVNGRLQRHNGSAWETVPGFRGSGTTYPSDPVVGDSCFHTTLKSLMVYTGGVSDGSSWRQMTIAQLDTSTSLAGYISAVAAGPGFHYDFLVYEVASRRLYVANSGTSLRPASPQDFANSSVNAGNVAGTSAWQSTTFQWASSLGAKIIIPGDGVARTVKMFSTCNITGDGWLRIRADTGTGTTYWPNSVGKRSSTATDLEQDMTFIGRLSHDGSNDTVIYLEGRATSVGSCTFRIPVLDVTAF